MKLPWKKNTGADAGKTAENYAAAFLKQQGLRIVACNYRCRRGEIDLIARKGELLIFVEVRLRNHRGYASGAESVVPRKQQRLTTAAASYLQKTWGNTPPPCRFDVVSLMTNVDNDSKYHVEWLQDAFRPEN